MLKSLPNTHVKVINISGEVIDITAASNNNKYGNEKLNYSMIYGISYPLEKYIKELNMIIQDNAFSEIKDDKQDKRKDRIYFLTKCNDNYFLQQYFKSMCNLLNGGHGNIDWQHENTPLIIVCAGGNIITIFAKLLLNLINNLEKSEKLNSTNNKLLTFIELPEIDIREDYIKPITNDKHFIAIINQITNQNFSDFDFNIVMNKNTFEPNPEHIEHNMEQYKKAGFLLYRNKSKSSYDKFVDNNNIHTHNPCKDIQNMPDILYTQVFQDAMIDHVKRQKINKSQKQNCLEYLEYLKETKNIISQTTKFNTNLIIQKWKNNFSFDSDLDAIVDYIHNVNYVLNNSLTAYIKFQTNDQYTKKYYNLWKQNFSTLETMFHPVSFNNKTYSLPDVMSFLLLEYLRNEKLHTKTIMELNDQEQDILRKSISNDFNTFQNVNTAVRKIGNSDLKKIIINSSQTADHILQSAANNFRKDIQVNEEKIPRYNAYLTLNCIITDKEDTPAIEDYIVNKEDQSYIETITKGGKNKTKRKLKRKQKQKNKKTKTKKRK